MPAAELRNDGRYGASSPVADSRDAESKLRTYVALAASGRSKRSPTSSGGNAAGGSGGARLRLELAAGGPTTSAFFKLPYTQRQRQVSALGPHCAAPVAGSVTPPSSRPTSRAAIATPDSVASASLDADDEILFQMSGLKPLRTSSRTATATVAMAAAATLRGRSTTRHMHSAQAVKAEGRSASPGLGPAGLGAAAEPVLQCTSPLNRAFAFADKLSPPAGRVPTAAFGGRSRAEAALAAIQAGKGVHKGVSCLPDQTTPAAETARADCPPSNDASAAQAEAVPTFDAPGWLEELLNWMLSEKAGLLMEAQRAARRQQELEAEIDSLHARGSSAEREAHHLAVSCF